MRNLIRSVIVPLAVATAVVAMPACQSGSSTAGSAADGPRADGTESPRSDAFELRAGDLVENDGWTRTDLVIGGSKVWMAEEAAVDASMIEAATCTLDGSGRSAVLVELDEEGTSALERLSAGQLSRPIVVIVDGRPTSAPVVMSPLGARFMITADHLTDDQCEDLARRLSGG